MKDLTTKSAFYHFGLLPEICVHSLVEDPYSKMYIARAKCECGCSEWVEGKMDLMQPVKNFKPIQKDVHRCKECNSVRMADHIGVI